MSALLPDRAGDEGVLLMHIQVNTDKNVKGGQDYDRTNQMGPISGNQQVFQTLDKTKQQSVQEFRTAISLFMNILQCC